MTKIARVTLQTLKCIKQDEESGAGSEPYIWTLLAGFAQAPFSFQTTPRAGIIGAAPKLVLGSNLRPGQRATLPSPFNQLSLTFRSGQSQHQLVLIVAMLEDDGSRGETIAQGHQAFVDALQGQAAPRFLEFLATDPEDAIPLGLEIVDQAWAKAMSAMAKTLKLGETHLRDDLLGIAIRGFRKPLHDGSRPFVLTFDTAQNRFTLDGVLSFTTVIENPGGGGRTGGHGGPDVAD